MFTFLKDIKTVSARQTEPESTFSQCFSNRLTIHSGDTCRHIKFYNEVRTYLIYIYNISDTYDKEIMLSIASE